MPYLVGDARSFTNWNASCVTHEAIKKSAGITDEYSYRRYLEKNALNLIKQNAESAYNGRLQSPICKDCGRLSQK